MSSLFLEDDRRGIVLSRISFALLTLLVALAICNGRAFGQESQTAASTNTGIQPALLWMLDVSAGQGYDDNPFAGGHGGYYAEFDPHFSFGQQRRHGSWLFDFEPNVQHFYNSANLDRVNERVSTNDSWQMSRRWSFNLNGNYLHTSDPFAQIESAGPPQTVTSPGVTSPNHAFVGPESPYTAFGGSGTFGYQIRRRTQLAFGGDYFTNRETRAGLSNTSTEAARAGYFKMVRRGQTLGLNYSAQFISVVNPSESLTSHTLLLSYNFEWHRGRQLYFFAGPQYSKIHAIQTIIFGPFTFSGTLNQRILSYAAGTTFSMLITPKNTFQVTASRRVSDGAGVSGSAIQDLGQFEISRRLTKRLSASVGGFYSEYQALGKLPVIEPNTWSGSSHAEFQVSPRGSFSISYDYFHQPLISSTLSSLFSHNRALLAYHYAFGTSAERSGR